MWQTRESITFENQRLSEIDFHWGFEYRPLFHTINQLGMNSAIQWCDRFSEKEAISAELALALVLEKVNQVEVPQRAIDLRIFFCELQRVQWCLRFIRANLQATHEKSLLARTERLIEWVYDALDALTGSRVLPHALCFSGVDRELTLGQDQRLKRMLLQIQNEFFEVFQDLQQDLILKERLQNILPITAQFCEEHLWGGIVGRASGWKFDLRKSQPYSGYERFEWADQSLFPTRNQSDAWDRFMMAGQTLHHSLQMCNQILAQISAGSVHGKILNIKIPEQSAEVLVEAPTGPLLAQLKNGKVFLQSSSMRIADKLEKIILGIHQDDYEVALASLGFDFVQADLLFNPQLGTSKKLVGKK